MTISDASLDLIGFPELDGAAKHEALFDLEIHTERAAWWQPEGETATVPLAPKKDQPLASSFTVAIGDLPCARVRRIDGFTVKQGIVSDIRLTIAAADHRTWAAAARADLAAESASRDGEIVLMDAALKRRLATITLSGVHIRRFGFWDSAQSVLDGGSFVVDVDVRAIDLSIGS